MALRGRSCNGLGGLAVGLVLATLVGCTTPQVASGPSAAVTDVPAIAVQSPVGLPAAKATRLADRLIGSLQSRGVSLAATPSSPARFELKGFCSAADGGGATSFVCVWDATTSTGARAQRIVTEERVPGLAPGNPASVIGNATLDEVADTVAAKIAAWLPSAPASGSGVSWSLPSLIGSDRSPPIAIAGVSGAPGDGNTALASAMGSALRSQNVPVSAGGPGAYRLSGKVALSDAGGGEQTVVIEWELADPQGTPLGVITQRNRVPSGALAGAWGATAEDAAGAAADGVIRLLPTSS